MLSCGIDVGSLSAQAVLLGGRRVLTVASQPVRPNPVDSARRVVHAALARTGRSAADIGASVATGYGRDEVVAAGLARGHLSEIACHGAGAHWLRPRVRTVIDVGGQDAKAIQIEAGGRVADFVMNDKCASGTGRFLEAMCRTLDVPLKELGPLALRGGPPLALAARCSIFCETEVLHHLQRGAAPPALAAGICQAMARRVAGLVRRVAVSPEVMMTGGVAHNAAVRQALSRRLGITLVPCPVDPQGVGALGAAVLAAAGRDRPGGGAR